jgi:hypothetical protein
VADQANALGLIVTILVMPGVVAGIVLFEKRRAQQIEQDLRKTARPRRARRPPDDN